MSRLATLPHRLRRPTETRESAVQVAKAVIAGTGSWWVAGPVLGLAAAAFAPLAALMVVGLTVRRSMLESARHIVAVLIGAVPRCRLSRMLAFGGERPGYLAG